MAAEPGLVTRILFRLERAEIEEINPHFKDDYRIAWITVLRASRGEPQPVVTASYAVLGIHPDKVWDAIVARRRSKLGPDYDKFFSEHPPKKPAQSVRPDIPGRRKGSV